MARCALGTSPDVAAALAREERRLGGPPDVRRVFATGVAAYLYGLPEVALRRTVTRFPRNVLVQIAELADPSIRTVVAPNVDTLYGVAQVDLSGGPLVLEAPDTGGRYAVLQLLDAFTNAFAYLGVGERGERGERALLVPPGWRGTVPAGLRLVRSPSRLVWVLARTLADGPADVAAARTVQAGYALTPLAAWLQRSRNAALVLARFPPRQTEVELPQGVALLDALGADLAADPPPRRDACALRAFARAGIGPGRTPSAERDPYHRAALAAAGRVAPRLLARLVRERLESGGAWIDGGPTIGRYGRDYTLRAAVATVGLGANTPERARYPRTARDAEGRLLDGRRSYRIRFAPGRLPPVREFWSLTLYGPDRFLYANPQRVYALGDRTRGLRRARDGSLTLWIGHRRPRGAPRANWLPAPRGRFELTLRLYEPRPAAAAGRWRPPPVVPVG